MKVTSVGSKTQQVSSTTSKDKPIKTQAFSDSLDMANKHQNEQRLQQMLDDIDNLGKRMTSTRSVEDAKKYKSKVQEYLSFIVKNIYVLKKEAGPFNYGIHVRIEVINEKLDELTKDVIDQQKDHLDLANKLEEIRGLLVDAYR